jgi:hypothetical protein
MAIPKVIFTTAAHVRIASMNVGGYGAKAVWSQAADKPCMSIDPVSRLVNTDEIDPRCGGRDPNKNCPEK